MSNINFRYLIVICTVLSNIIIFPFVLTVIATNETTGLGYQFLKYSIPCLIILNFCISFIVLAIKLYSKKTYDILIVLIFIIASIIYVQNYIIPWSYGVIDGNDFPGVDLYKTIISTLLIGLIIFLSFRFLYTSINNTKIILLISSLLIIGHSIEISMQLYNKNLKNKDFQLTEKFEFDLGKSNTIVFVLDSLSHEIFSAATKEREIRDLLDGFTYFKNNQGNYIYTTPSIPAMLTGKTFDNLEPFNKYLNQSFKTDEYYRTMGQFDNVYIKTDVNIIYPSEIISNLESAVYTLSDLRLILKIIALKSMPDYFKEYFWLSYTEINREKNNAHIDVSTANKDYVFYRRIVDGTFNIKFNNAFKFYHLQGAHPKLELDKNINIYQKSNQSFASRKINQSIASFKIVASYIKKLKELGLYNQSKIIIAADHGSENDLLLSYYNGPVLFYKGVNDNNKGIINSESPTQISDLFKFYSLDFNPSSISNSRSRNLYIYNGFDDNINGFLPTFRKFENLDVNIKPGSFVMDEYYFESIRKPIPYKNIKVGDTAVPFEIAYTQFDQEINEKTKYGIRNLFISKDGHGEFVYITNDCGVFKFGLQNKTNNWIAIGHYDDFFKGYKIFYNDSKLSVKDSGLSIINVNGGKLDLKICGMQNKALVPEIDNQLIELKAVGKVRYIKYIDNKSETDKIIFGNYSDSNYYSFIGSGWGVRESTHTWCKSNCEFLFVTNPEKDLHLDIQTVYPMQVENFKLTINDQSVSDLEFQSTGAEMYEYHSKFKIPKKLLSNTGINIIKIHNVASSFVNGSQLSYPIMIISRLKND